MTEAWPPRVKICGTTRRQDAEAAAAAGAAYLGVILAPGYRRTVSPAAAGDLLAGLGVSRVGVFVDAGREAVLEAADRAALDVLQLHGDEDPELAAELRAAGYAVWKAVRPRSGAEFARAAGRWAGAVDALLVDGWHPAAAGGTGTRFDWAAVAALRGSLPTGVALVAAGGLTPANVAEAVRVLRPHVVDVSSGVESAPGVKDPDAVQRFVAAVRSLPSD